LSILKKIKESIVGKPVMDNTYVKGIPLFPNNKNIKHEYVSFDDAYRIALLTQFRTTQEQDIVHNYRKKIINLGYECEALMFLEEETKDASIYLQSFGLTDLDKEGIPQCPRTDRFTIRRFDILINLYFNPCPQLLYISKNSNAKCRVGPFMDHFTNCSDVLIPVGEEPNLNSLIETINNTLNIKPYVRKEI